MFSFLKFLSAFGILLVVPCALALSLRLFCKLDNRWSNDGGGCEQSSSRVMNPITSPFGLLLV